ncbi:MAG TPA: zinc ribbon domain-containing protein [Acidobacteriota bacterium]|nr:zinc ribbon domain-containing protein [Acidobacteriota bacterium]
MPLYEYRCKDCHQTIELIQKVSDPPPEACPQCGGTLEKLLSAPAIRFKGEGWYITDYSDKGKAPKKEESKDKDSKDSKDSKAKSETKSGDGKASKASKKSSSDAS